MAKVSVPTNNLKILTEEELAFFKSKYTIEIDGDKVLVTANSIKRTTCHLINENISLGTSKRRLIIPSMTLQIWKEHFLNKYTVFDVQQSISTLNVLHQELDTRVIEEQILRRDCKIKLV